MMSTDTGRGDDHMSQDDSDEGQPPAGPVGHPYGIGKYTVVGHDELGYRLLGEECPKCSAQALYIEYGDVVECLTCAWKDPEPIGGKQ